MAVGPHGEIMTPAIPKIIAIIGARSGSKGLPHKNIKPLAGKPLMAWIIQAAKKSNYIQRVFVSTDSEEYAAIARQHGAETPFLRSAEISQDSSLDIDYIKHALQWLQQNENYIPDIVVRLLPTTPLQTSEDMDACIEQLLDKDVDSAVVIAEARQHPAKALKIIEDRNGETSLVSYISGTGKDVNPISRQSYPKAYFRANVIVTRTKLINVGLLTGEEVAYHIIPQERAVDIDSEVDFLIAEILIKKYKNAN